MDSLSRQVEKINDESDSGRFTVIVQTRTREDLKRHLQSAGRIIEQRRSTVSVRELAPRRMTERRPSAKLKPPANGSAIERFSTSDWARNAISATGGLKRKAMGMQTFPALGLAALSVTKEQLNRLPEESPFVSAVFVNREVRLPPVARTDRASPAIEENRGFTWGLMRTGAMSAWGAFDVRGQGVKVAVLDTGVDATHPDLKGKISGFAEFGPNGETVVDDVTKAYDSDRHGTHCAGTVVGGRASGHWIGMAPEARILAGLVLKKGRGTDLQILAGIEWAIAKGANVISMSLGGLRMSADVLDTYTSAFIGAQEAGIPVVVAIGNDGHQTSGAPGNDFFAFTVGAVDVDDRAAGFSGGRTQVVGASRFIDSRYLPFVYSKPDVVAPGVDVLSAIPGKKYDAWNGTSMATPHVAGAMALLLSDSIKLRQLPVEDRSQALKDLIVSTCQPLGESGQNHRFGFGRINVLRAVGRAIDLGY